MSENLNKKIMEYYTLSSCRKVTKKVRIEIDKERNQQKHRLDAQVRQYGKRPSKNDKKTSSEFF